MASIVDEIVKAVAKKTKMPEAVAKIAVDTALSTLKKKLPSNVGGILDSFLDSGSSTGSKSKSGKSKKDDSLLDDISSIAGKFLGGK